MRLPLSAFFAMMMTIAPAGADHGDRHIHMVKNKGCGCCTLWANIARRHGFDVTVEETLDYAGTKKRHGVPFELAACHTSTVAGYVVEGHVPMNAIEKLLAERPSAHGITVPGMPAGSPGMGDDPEARYDVLLFEANQESPVRTFVEMGTVHEGIDQ